MTSLRVGHRWQLALVLMVTFFVAFMDRINITFALPLMAQEFNWTEAETQKYGSLLMGLFYGAYGLANILLTPIAARAGPRRSLMVIICLWSLFTAMGAWVSQLIMLLMASRVLLGLSEGVHVPMMTTLTKAWFPLEERARGNSIIVAGIFLAVLLAPLMLVPLMSTLGWRAGFLLLAASGALLSLPLVYRYVYNEPEQHAGVSGEELAHILASRELEAQAHTPGQGLREIFTHPVFMLFFLIGVFSNLLSIGISGWLPTYFTNKRGIPFEEITWLVTAPYAFSLVGVAVWSWIGDRFNVRSLVAGGGFALSGVVILIALGTESLWLVVVCMTAAVFLFSAYTANEFALVQRIVPMDRFAEVMGTYNGLTALIGGGLGPALMSPLIGDGEGTWIITAIAVVNGVLLFRFYRMVRY